VQLAYVLIFGTKDMLWRINDVTISGLLIPRQTCQGSQYYAIDPFRVFSASRADIDSEHFGNIMFLTEDFEVLALTEQDVMPLPQFPPDTLFAVRWHARATSDPEILSCTSKSTRATISKWMGELPVNCLKWQEVLSHSMSTEDDADTDPSVHSETTGMTDLHRLRKTIRSAKTNADSDSILSASKLQHTQEPPAAAETPTPSPVAAAEARDNPANNVFPLLYHMVVKVILLICFLTLCTYLLDWAWTINLSYLETKFTFEGDFEAHTTFNKTQAEISFVYHALYAVLVALYFMLW
jgi:hypothetical protein